MNTMCGTSVENCTPERWLKFLGTYNKNLHVPFNIQVSMIRNNSAKAMREHAFGCYESSDMSQTKCSCENCKASCEREDPYPNLENEGCTMATMDCNTAITLLAFGCICLTTMFIIVAHYVLKHSTDDEIDNMPRCEFQLPAVKEEGCQFCTDTPQINIHHLSLHDFLRTLCIRYSKVGLGNSVEGNLDESLGDCQKDRTNFLAFLDTRLYFLNWRIKGASHN